jgi:hypothetical protein
MSCAVGIMSGHCTSAGRNDADSLLLQSRGVSNIREFLNALKVAQCILDKKLHQNISLVG